MRLSIPQPATGTYRVEVSGWDSSLEFFVEKSELAWSEETGKQITLARALRKGTMVFVRLLQPTASDRASSVAYWAEYITTIPEGFHQFRLKQIHPRA